MHAREPMLIETMSTSTTLEKITSQSSHQVKLVRSAKSGVKYYVDFDCSEAVRRESSRDHYQQPNA